MSNNSRKYLILLLYKMYKSIIFINFICRCEKFKQKCWVVYEDYLVSISSWDFDINLMSALTVFWSAGEKSLQGNLTILAILHRGAKRAILKRVNLGFFPFHVFMYLIFHCFRVLSFMSWCTFFPPHMRCRDLTGTCCWNF